MPSTILYLGRNDLDRSTTIAINGIRYEYFFDRSTKCDVVEQLSRRGLPTRALLYAKQHAFKTEKLQ